MTVPLPNLTFSSNPIAAANPIKSGNAETFTIAPAGINFGNTSDTYRIPEEYGGSGATVPNPLFNYNTKSSTPVAETISSVGNYNFLIIGAVLIGAVLLYKRVK